MEVLGCLWDACGSQKVAQMAQKAESSIGVLQMKGPGASDYGGGCGGRWRTPRKCSVYDAQHIKAALA